MQDIFKKLEGKKLDVTIGGSFVSKYQSDENQTYVLPENTGAYGGRASLRYGRFNLDANFIILCDFL